TFPNPPLAPAEILSHVNRHMTSMVPDGMFATAIYSVYDSQARALRYANAGHPFPRCRREGVVLPLASAGGLPLGISWQERWEEHEFSLRARDAVVFFTDGLVEGMD